MARGRKRKSGDRYSNGRLRPVRDRGNDRIRALRELYAVHGSGKAGDDLDCALGQAHAAGLLDGADVDARILLEHGREWHRLYRRRYGGSVRTSDFERVDRSEPDLETRSADLRFRLWSRVVDRLEARERAAIDQVCIRHGEGGTLPAFLERLINGWKKKRRPPLYDGDHLPIAGDFALLASLKSGLVDLARGVRAPRQGP